MKRLILAAIITCAATPSFAVDPTVCFQRPMHGMADANGNVTSAPIYASPDSAAPDPAFSDSSLGNDTSLVVSGAHDVNGRTMLVGRLYFRQEPYADRDIASPEFDWNCNFPLTIDSRPLSDTVRTKVAASIKSSLADPYSIRSARIGPIYKAADYPQASRIACVWFNAKNKMGGYVGISSLPIKFYEGGEKIWIPDIKNPCLDASSTAPFPELGIAD